MDLDFLFKDRPVAMRKTREEERVENEKKTQLSMKISRFSFSENLIDPALVQFLATKAKLR